MILGRKALFSLLLGFELLTNVLELTHFNFLYISTLIFFCTSILLPGFLISLTLRIRKISFWENLLMIIGLGLSFLEFGGLLLNILLPLIGVKNPLALQNIIIGFDVYTLLLFIFAWIRTKPLALQIQLPKRTKIEKALYALPVFFPLLATLGAIRLNNGSSNILTLILLGAIACYSLLLVLLRAKIPVDLYAYALFFIGLSCLFTTSLRSWYITGHDIEREFYVFQLTNTHHVWNMAFYQDAYNACLSITILPTILTNLLSIHDMYVYKVIFQILFAFSPVLVYFIVNNYTIPVLSFLSALFFVSFPTFFNDMPMLNRQEIGFLLFGMVLYVMLLSETPSLVKKILFIIFALSVVVSHYSTNFVSLALVTFVYVFTLIISLPLVKKTWALLLPKSHIRLKNTFPNKAFLSLPLILLLFLMTYVWNTIYTNSSHHTVSVIEKVINGLFAQSNEKSNDLSYSIFLAPPKQDPKRQLQDYISSTLQSGAAIMANASTTQVKASTTQVKASTTQVKVSPLYSQSITSRYPSYPIPQEQLPPTAFGNFLTTLHIPVFTILAQLRLFSAYFMQFFSLVGLLYLLFFNKHDTFDLQYMLLCFGALCLLALITLLPTLSVEYGVLRMFQQFLFILSLPIVLGLNASLFFIKYQERPVFIAIIVITFFLNLTGFITHLTGYYYPQMHLDNSGLYYDSYYVHKSDFLAIVWLSKNKGNNELVECNRTDLDKLLTYGDISASCEIFPPLIRKNAYVYLNISLDRSFFNSDYFNSPKRFLDDNKNIIYSNGNNNIYK
jgi:uncharacterized membrane protein